MKCLRKGQIIEMIEMDSIHFYYMFVKNFGYKFPKLTKAAFVVRHKVTPKQGWHLKKKKHKKDRCIADVHNKGVYQYRSELFSFTSSKASLARKGKYMEVKRVYANRKNSPAIVPKKRINTHGGVVFMDQIDPTQVELCGAYE